MKMRPPATPLITVDPYFSLWSTADRLTDRDTVHWTLSPQLLRGTLSVDGQCYRFLGMGEAPAMEQISTDLTALVTEYLFRCAEGELSLSFYSTLFCDDLYRLSRPVSYLRAAFTPLDGKTHTVKLTLTASEEFCINKRGEEAVEANTLILPDGGKSIRIGSKAQRVLWRDGDDVRIDWGWFYLSGNADCKTEVTESEGMCGISLTAPLSEQDTYLTFAYDDIHSLIYFGKEIDAYWRKDGKSITEVIAEASREGAEMLCRCRDFSLRLDREAQQAGGEKYGELLRLAYRQVLAAHKLALDPEGELLFISKECFSDGCAATVDVTYPSAPMLLLYNPELLKGTLRPIFRFARTPEWKYDFAPHDAGIYPILNRQMYWYQKQTGEHPLDKQMPVEECGNMLILMASLAMVEGNADFALPQMDLLNQWVQYLLTYGADPGNQLCTDDFAGHLAHNCNLSLKAIMGIEGYGKLLEIMGRGEEAQVYFAKAKEMADSWVVRAANEDGSFRLAFDAPGTFSMKYNMVWDKLWGSKLFAPSVYYSEFCSNQKRINAYGMPLDSRADYTKSDWLVWTALLAPTKEEFADFIAPLWLSYHVTHHRVPMTDWYSTVTAEHYHFQNRTVQGGLFLKLLEQKWACE